MVSSAQIDRKEKAMKLLEGQVKRLEEQQRDYENKVCWYCYCYACECYACVMVMLCVMLYYVMLCYVPVSRA